MDVFTDKAPVYCKTKNVKYNFEILLKKGPFKSSLNLHRRFKSEVSLCNFSHNDIKSAWSRR